MTFIYKQINHTYVDDPFVDPDCTHTGLTQGRHSSVCGKVLVPQITVPALGHVVIIDDAVPATTTHTGLTEGSHCCICGEVIKAQEIIPQLTEPPFAINTQPDDYFGSIGDVAVFRIMADEENLHYQWQEYKNGEWINSTSTGNARTTFKVKITQARIYQQFRCVVSDDLGNTLISNTVQIFKNTQYEGPEIKLQPQNFAGDIGDVAVFRINAEGFDLHYQWQEFKNNTWVNSSSTGNATSTFKVKINQTRVGQKFKCVVTDSLGFEIDSNIVTIKLLGPEIITQPDSYTGNIGEIAVFKIVAEGDNLHYQWQEYKNNEWINSTSTGNSTANFKVKITQGRVGQQFKCVVTDANGRVIVSDIVKININGIVITSQPTNYFGSIGDVAVFRISAVGNKLHFQWQEYQNNTWINSSWTGNTTATFKIKVSQTRIGQPLRCVVTDENGNEVSSSIVTILVV